VGEPVDGHGLRWRLGDESLTCEIARPISEHVLPFARRMGSRQEMMQWLESTRFVKKRYPTSIVSLAILQSPLGTSPEGCALSDDIRKKAIGAWLAGAAEVVEWIGCAK